jgi:type II secretory pathway component PulF
MISTLEMLNRYGKYLAVLPILLLLPLFIYAWRTSRSAANAHRLTRFLSRFPGAGHILQYGTLAMYFEMLQLLVSQSAPLDEALPLAAQASGDPDLVDASLDLTNRIHRGESVVEVTRSIGSLPPLIACLLAASPSSDKLAKSLRRLAEAYHRQATNAASRFRVSFPILATFFIGGATTALYALIFFLPWFTFLTNLAMPPA